MPAFGGSTGGSTGGMTVPLVARDGRRQTGNVPLMRLARCGFRKYSCSKKYWPHRPLKVGIAAAIHFKTLIPWLRLCNARARRAGEGIGHTVHEGDDSLMSFCKTSGPGPPGPFFLAVRVSRTHDADVLAMRLSGEHSGGSAT
jgi:hypothetical protein